MSTYISIEKEGAESGYAVLHELKEVYPRGEKRKYQITTHPSVFCGHNKVPNIRVVDEDVVERALERLKNTPIFICPPPGGGCDGKTTTLSIKRGANHVTFAWWGFLPDEWKNLSAVFELFGDHSERQAGSVPTSEQLI